MNKLVILGLSLLFVSSVRASQDFTSPSQTGRFTTEEHAECLKSFHTYLKIQKDTLKKSELSPSEKATASEVLKNAAVEGKKLLDSALVDGATAEHISDVRLKCKELKFGLSALDSDPSK